MKRELEVNLNWTCKEISLNLKAMKEQYDVILSSFFWTEPHEKNEFIRRTKHKIYSLNLPEWKKDKIWDYFNNYEFLYVVKNLISRCK